MATSTAHADGTRGIRARVVSGARVLLRRLREFHDGGVRAQYVIWDRLCDFGDDQAGHPREVAGNGRARF